MAHLVLFVVATITGLVSCSETAKVEKRFNRGPLGVPAFAWGFVAFIGAAIIGALLGSEVVVGALIGFVAYTEAVKYANANGAPPFGVIPPAWGVVCGSLGLIGALVESTFPIWLVVGFVAYREAATYETQYGKPTLRLPAPVWGVAGFFFGIVGGLVVTPLAWAAVCVILGLIGSNLLLLAERDALLSAKNASVADKKAPAASRPAPAPAPAPTPVVTAPPDQRWAAAAPGRFGSQPPAAQPPVPHMPTPQPGAPLPSAGVERDLLPRKR